MDVMQLFEIGFCYVACAAAVTVPLFLVVMIATAIGRRWLAPWSRQALWSLVLLRLLIPESLYSPLSLQPTASWVFWNVYSVFDRLEVDTAVDVAAEQLEAKRIEDAINIRQVSDAGTANSSTLQMETASLSSAVPFDWYDFFLIRVFGSLVVVGSVLTCLWTMVTTIRLHQWIRRGTVCLREDWLKLLAQGQMLFGVDGPVTLRIVPQLMSPATYGWWRPMILLPEDAATLSEAELRHVVWHELAHIRRHDIAQNWILAIVRVCHWWNPVFWWAQSAWLAERELACDALAMRRLDGSQSSDYGKTLLGFLERVNVRDFRLPSSIAPGLVSFFDRKRTLKRRLVDLARLAKPERPWRRWLGKSLIVVLGIAGLTDAAARPEPVSNTTSIELPEGTTWNLESRSRSDRNDVRTIVEYDVSATLQGLHQDPNICRLTDELPVAFLKERIESQLRDVPEFQASASDADNARSSERQSSSNLQIHEKQFVVCATALQHSAIQRLLNRWRDVGMPQLTIETRQFATRESLKKILPTTGGEIVNSSRINGDPEFDIPVSEAESHTWTEHNVPAFVQTLNENQVKTLVNRLQGDPRSNHLFHPKITLFDGQFANVNDYRLRPFVTGLSPADRGEYQPQVSQVNEGFGLTIRAETATDLKSTQLNIRYLLTSITDVKVLQVQTAGEPRSVQIPHVAHSVISVSRTVPPEHSVLVVPLERNADGVLQICLIRPQVIHETIRESDSK